jgi:hypothetical protein
MIRRSIWRRERDDDREEQAGGEPELERTAAHVPRVIGRARRISSPAPTYGR